MGPFYGGFIPPAVETLPDRDKRQWEAGFDGKPADTWQLHWNVVLQHVDTAELFTFDTSSDTGCRSVEVAETLRPPARDAPRRAAGRAAAQERLYLQEKGRRLGGRPGVRCHWTLAGQRRRQAG